MSDAVVATVAWIGLALHVVVGIAAIRVVGARSLVPLMNLITGACVLLYWAYRWFGYLFRGITWYAADQLIPLYALLVCILAGVTLANRYPAMMLNGVVFVFHAIILTLAVLFVAFFRMNRLF